MLLSEIQQRVFSRVQAASDLVPCLFDGKGAGAKQAGLYATVDVVPLDNREPVFCDGVTRSGFIFVKVYAKRGYGTHGVTIEAEKFIALFPEDWQQDGLSIPDTGDIKGRLDSETDGWFYVPITIYYEAK